MNKRKVLAGVLVLGIIILVLMAVLVVFVFNGESKSATIVVLNDSSSMVSLVRLFFTSEGEEESQDWEDLAPGQEVSVSRETRALFVDQVTVKMNAAVRTKEPGGIAEPGEVLCVAIKDKHVVDVYKRK